MIARLLVVLGLTLFVSSPHAQRDLSRAADQTSNVWKFPEYVTSCMKIDALVKGAATELAIVEDFQKSLGWVGPAIGLSHATLLAYEGKNLDAVQKLGAVGADALVCMNATICPAWAVGRTIGDVINGLVSVSRKDSKSATDLMEDLYISVAFDAPATAREFVKLELAVARAKARRQSVVQTVRTCADPRQTRSGVDELIGASKPAGTSLPKTPIPIKSNSANTECAVLKDTTASERLSASDPNAYDALLARCL